MPSYSALSTLPYLQQVQIIAAGVIVDGSVGLAGSAARAKTCVSGCWARY
ncbi:MAG: hypothetical protein ACJARI_003350 [Bacteroidia bacterium]|jgi:hypothetical protein